MHQSLILMVGDLFKSLTPSVSNRNSDSLPYSKLQVVTVMSSLLFDSKTMVQLLTGDRF